MQGQQQQTAASAAAENSSHCLSDWLAVMPGACKGQTLHGGVSRLHSMPGMSAAQQVQQQKTPET